MPLESPEGGFSSALAAELLAHDAPLSATRHLALALGVPTDDRRGGRFALGAPLRGALLVEVLFGCLQLCKDYSFSAGQAALSLAALHGLLRFAVEAPSWPSHAEACAQWSAAVAGITTPPRQPERPPEVVAAEAAIAPALTEEQAAAAAAAHAPEDLLPLQLANALFAWVQDNGALLPHHWDMYREALGGGGSSRPVCGGTRLITRVVVVEEPPPPETLPPLCIASHLHRSGGGEEVAPSEGAAASQE